MGQRVKLVVIVPVGTRENTDYLCDTLESVRFYSDPCHKVILVDDSGSGAWESLKRPFPEIIILRNKKSFGLQGGLYFSLSGAYRYAVENFLFEVLLKLDSDALIIGRRAEDEAIRYFRESPDVGLIGSYKVRCDGGIRNFSGPGRQILRDMGLWGLISNPKRSIATRRIVSKALKNGYEMGEHCLGGAYFLSFSCLTKLYQEGLLSRVEFLGSRVGEDAIFGLLLRSVGINLGDFVTGDKPMCLTWRGLPYSPEELVAREKKVIHSTRFWEDMGEEQIRNFFKTIRRQEDLSGHSDIDS